MRIKPQLIRSTFFFALILAGCVQPITKEAREQVDQQTTFAMVSEDPNAFIGQSLIVGGVIMTIESSEKGSVLEVMEWQLNRWGEPLYLDDVGRRFMVKTSERLDSMAYEAGALVTLSGVILGSETHQSSEQEYNYPILGLNEIHLWDIPFRYGIHSNSDPSYPYYVDQSNDPHRHPYDPGYNPYPYTQHWYRRDNR